MKTFIIVAALAMALTFTSAYAIEVVMPVKVKEIVYEQDNTMTFVVINEEGDTFTLGRMNWSDCPEDLWQKMYMCFDLSFVGGSKCIMGKPYLTTTEPKK